MHMLDSLLARLPRLPLRRLFGLLPVAGLLMLPAGAGAQTIERIDIDGVAVNLVVPAAYCKVDRGSPLGRNFYEPQERMQSGVNRVLLIYADCKQLAIGNAASLSRYGMYLGALQQGRVTKIPPTYSRQQALEEMAKSIPAIDPAAMQNQTNARAGQEGARLEKMTTGLLGRDDNALYLGVAANASQGGGAGTRMRGVTLITVLKGLAISGSLYGPAEAGAPFAPLLEAQKGTAAGLVKAN